MKYSCIENKNDPDHLAPAEWEGHKTIWEGYQATVQKYPNHKFLGTRSKTKEGNPYEWKSWSEIFEVQNDFAKGKYLL